MADNIYESDRLVREYLLFHYGSPGETLLYPFGPRDALGFAQRCVTELLDTAALPHGARALDVGCAVGRSSFELARRCAEVVALDRSQAFIEAAETIRTAGSLDYEYTVEGARTAAAVARCPDGIDPSRVRFAVGDAMALPSDLGSFDVVMAANLLCRLPRPRTFLGQLPTLVKSGGQLLLATPFSWLAEFTTADEWIGGRPEQSSADELKQILKRHFRLDLSVELPFLIREHARKFQWGVAWGTRWIRL